MSTKVFVGNLAFRATDQDLQEHFGGFGEIKSAVIITRGRRSLGYGFVEFGLLSEAEAAVEALDQKSILNLSFNSRPIKVEIAKELAEREPREPRDPREPKPREPREPKEPRTKQPSEPRQPKAGRSQSPNEDGDVAPKRKRVRKQRRSKKGANTGDAPNSTSTSNVNNSGGAQNAGEGGPAKKRERVRKERPQREKVLSRTTLFVANLPFSLSDDELKQIFDEQGFVSARVVRTRNGRSRGYGFVEYDTEEHQQIAMKEKENYSVPVPGQENRILSISISSSPAPPDANEAKGE